MDDMWQVEIQEYTSDNAPELHGALASFVGWRSISYHVERDAALVIFDAELKAGRRVRLTSPEQS